MNGPDPHGSGLPHSVPPVPHIAPPGMGGDNQQAVPYPEQPVYPPQLPPIQVPPVPQFTVPPAPQIQIPMPPQIQIPTPHVVHPPMLGAQTQIPAPAAPKQNSMAVTAIILAIISPFYLGPLISIPAMICGFIGRRQINESGGTQTGTGMAMTGIVLGAVVTVGSVLLLLGWLVTMLLASPYEAPLY